MQEVQQKAQNGMEEWHYILHDKYHSQYAVSRLYGQDFMYVYTEFKNHPLL
jgi:hypothetical protein